MTQMQALTMLLRVVVVFLITLFALLCFTFPKLEFFRWWTAAWAIFGLHLGFDLLGRTTGVQVFFLFQLLAGYIQSPLLFAGAVHYHSPLSKTTGRGIWRSVLSALAAGLLFYSFSFWASAAHAELVRHLPRKLLLAAALAYCFWACLDRWITARSWSALATAIAFAISSINELGSSIDWFASAYAVPLPALILKPAHVLALHQFALGLMWPFVISLGMILVLLEEHRRIELAEAASTRARQELERNFGKAVRSSLDAITISELDTGRYVEANNAFLTLTGYEKDEVIGHTSLELGLWDTSHRDTFVAHLRHEGSLRNYEFEFRKRDGCAATLITSSELLDIGGKLYILSMIKDISDRKRAEQEIQELNKRLINAHEEERKRIAGELHDGALQKLTSLTLRLGAVKQKLSPDSEAKADIRALQQELIRVGTEIRHLSHELHPALLQDAGLPAALSSYCEEFSKVRGIPISYQADESVADLSPGAALCVYRIAQEALGNIAKHSRASKVDIRLTRDDSRVCLSVSDDGVGFNRSERSGGLGLINMRERVHQLNGTFEFNSEPGRGTTVRAAVPFRSAP